MKSYLFLLLGLFCLTACGGKSAQEEMATESNQPMTALDKAIEEQNKCLEKVEEEAKKEYEKQYGKMPTIMSEKELQQWSDILNGHNDDCRAEFDKVDELQRIEDEKNNR
ncbi:MAG: hypothetical protein IKZ88_00460 [Neisseriaceae bacterium]|nr:hypothetical protein [Neisseriaceae bacterium]